MDTVVSSTGCRCPPGAQRAEYRGVYVQDYVKLVHLLSHELVRCDGRQEGRAHSSSDCAGIATELAARSLQGRNVQRVWLYTPQGWLVLGGLTEGGYTNDTQTTWAVGQNMELACVRLERVMCTQVFALTRNRVPVMGCAAAVRIACCRRGCPPTARYSS